MYPVSATREVEVGAMLDPVSKEWQVYEEMWEDLEIVPVDGKHVVIVLKLDDTTAKARGVVVRVGRFCQGILRAGDQWIVERWEFRDGEEGNKGGVEDMDGGSVAGGNGNWKRTVRVGDMFLPCAVTFRPEIVLLGGTITHKGAEWKVEELVEWV